MEPSLDLSVALAEPNSSALTSRLPAELLCSVFEDSVDDAHRSSHTEQLLAITHVCKRWREIALGYEYLWTEIYLPSHPGFIDATLQRSGKSLLDVLLLRPSLQDCADVYCHMARCDNCIRRMRRDIVPIFESRRVRSLVIPGPDNVIPEVVSTSLEAPQLRTLHLVVKTAAVIPTLRPLLRSSYLARCEFPVMPLELWTELPTFRSLEVLVIGSIVGTSHAGPSLNLVMIQDVLKKLSQLRELRLPLSTDHHWREPRGRAQDERWPMEGVGAEISLPKLRDVELRGDAICCVSLLRTLVLPTYVSVMMRCQDPSRSLPDEYIRDCTTAITAAITSLSAQREMHMERDVNIAIDLQPGQETFQIKLCQKESSEIFVLWLLLPHCAQLLLAVCNSFAVARWDVPKGLVLHHLQAVRGGGILSEMADFVNSLPNLNIVLIAHSTTAFIDMFLTDMGMKLCQLEELFLLVPDVLPCSLFVHEGCENCIGRLQSACKKQLSPLNAVLRGLRILANYKMAPTDLEGLLEVADLVHYKCIEDGSPILNLKRAADPNVTVLGQTL